MLGFHAMNDLNSSLTVGLVFSIISITPIFIWFIKLNREHALEMVQKNNREWRTFMDGGQRGLAPDGRTAFQDVNPTPNKRNV